MGLRWWQYVLIPSQPKRYLDDRQARKYWGRSWDLKSSGRRLRSIYRCFSRQSKLRLCLVSQGESLIFPSSASSRIFLTNCRNTFIAVESSSSGGVQTTSIEQNTKKVAKEKRSDGFLLCRLCFTPWPPPLKPGQNKIEKGVIMTGWEPWIAMKKSEFTEARSCLRCSRPRAETVAV